MILVISLSFRSICTSWGESHNNPLTRNRRITRYKMLLLLSSSSSPTDGNCGVISNYFHSRAEMHVFCPVEIVADDEHLSFLHQRAFNLPFQETKEKLQRTPYSMFPTPGFDAFSRAKANVGIFGMRHDHGFTYSTLRHNIYDTNSLGGKKKYIYAGQFTLLCRLLYHFHAMVITNVTYYVSIVSLNWI